MDNLFKTRVLTSAVNHIQDAPMMMYNRYFRGKEHGEFTDRLAFDIITGNEGVLGNLSIYADADVTEKTDRKTITMEAPRMAHKRPIAASELNAVRAFGGLGAEMLKSRVAREQKDMKNMCNRTMEFWACNALKGKIYDKDMTTVLVDYNVTTAHQPKLTGADKWTDASSDPINKIRSWKKLIKRDAGTPITTFEAYLGSNAMDALLAHSGLRELLKNQYGLEMVTKSKLGEIVNVGLTEYDGYFKDDDGDIQEFIGEDYMLLVGECADLTDTPYAPIMVLNAPNGVGNVSGNNKMVMFYSYSWQNNEGTVQWVKIEGRPLPVLQRPGAVMYIKVV